MAFYCADVHNAVSNGWRAQWISRKSTRVWNILDPTHTAIFWRADIECVKLRVASRQISRRVQATYHCNVNISPGGAWPLIVSIAVDRPVGGMKAAHRPRARWEGPFHTSGERVRRPSPAVFLLRSH